MRLILPLHALIDRGPEISDSKSAVILIELGHTIFQPAFSISFYDTLPELKLTTCSLCLNFESMAFLFTTYNIGLKLVDFRLKERLKRK